MLTYLLFTAVVFPFSFLDRQKMKENEDNDVGSKTI